jgi:LysM repeat protein
MYKFALRNGFAMAALFAMASLVGATSASVVEAAPLGQGGTTVTVSPAQTSLACGETGSVDIRIGNVSKLFGVDIKVAYDPNVVEVVDADANASGVNVQPGDFPDVSGGQGLIQINSVDTGAGIIAYTAIRLNPAPAQTGSGVIANITFKGKAAGTSGISLESVTLADETAMPIAANTTDGEITVRCTGGEPTVVATPIPTRPGGSGRPTTAPSTPWPTKTAVPGGGKPTVPGPGTGGCTHIVKLGETLYSIARYQGVSVAAISAANGISNPNYIYAGQRLTIPGCGGTGKPTVPDPGKGPGHGSGAGPGCQTHYVKPGETLYSLAYMYGDSVNGIASRNGIVNPNMLWAGQGVTVCGGGGKPGTGSAPPPGYGKPLPGKPSYGKCNYTHYVKPGETLFGIAYRYGITLQAVQAANGLANPHLIYAGQAICIP